MRTISLPIPDRTIIATRAGAVLVAMALPLLSTDAQAQDPGPAVETPAPAQPAPAQPAPEPPPPPAGTSSTTTVTTSPGGTTYIERESVVVREKDDDDDEEDDEDEDDDKDDKRFRLSIDTELIGGAFFDPEGTGNSSISLGIGLARPSLLDGSNSLVMRPLIGLGLGYVFPGQRAVIGAKIGFTVDAYDLEESERLVAYGGRVVPYFHWMFLPDRRVRPYFEARLGFGGSGTTARDRGGAQGRVTQSFMYPIAGAGVGLHIFPRDFISIDLGFNADYVAPYATTRTRAGADDWDKVGDVVNYGMLLGLSTWF